MSPVVILIMFWLLQLSVFRNKKATIARGLFITERQGFEPWVRCRTHAFQACPLNRSGTSPENSIFKLYISNSNTESQGLASPLPHYRSEVDGPGTSKPLRYQKRQ